MAETPTTTKMGFIYPAFDQVPFYDTWTAFVNQLDAAVWAGREDPNLILRGGGNIVLDPSADELSWTQDIEIVSTLSGGKVVIEAAGSPLTGFEDGKMAYVTVARPIRGTSVATLSVTDTLGDDLNTVFVAFRDGDSVVMRNAGSLQRYLITSPTELTGTVTLGGGVATGSVAVDLDEGVVWSLMLEAAGNTVDTDIELYRDAGMTDLVWSASAVDAYTNPYQKDFIPWGEFTDRKVYYKVTNNGANDSTYTMSFFDFGRVD